jgi:hypothetical protein
LPAREETTVLRLSLFFAVPIGCSGDTDTADTAMTCLGGAPPVITDLYCENTGLMTYSPTGELVPTLTVWASIEDEDGDLTAYTSELFFDDIIDGVANTERSLGMIEGTIDDEPCDVPTIILGTTVYLRGGQPLYDTRYEWGVVVTDAAGQLSELVSVTCKTPDESGEGATQ